MAETFDTLVGLTTQIVSAHVSHNTVPSEQLPALIRSVYETLGGVSRTSVETPLEPAVPVKSSVKQETIACLECGKSFKMLRRHLKADHGMLPDQYRQRWKLPIGYPMVAPAYAKVRSGLAKQIGLGTNRISRAASRNK